MNKLIQMGIDLYNNKITDYSQADANEAFRKALLDVCGTDKIDYKVFRKHKNDLFELVEETLDELIPQILDNQFDRFVESKNVNWGDQKEFILPNVRKLFDIAIISEGNGNLRRQRIDEGGRMTIPTKMRGVKIYAPFMSFLAGRIDWAKMVNMIADSYNAKLRKEIFECFDAGFSQLGSTYGLTGSFDYEKLVELASHIDAEYGMGVTVFGTKSALTKVTSASGKQLSDRAKDELLKGGYLGSLDGMDFVELKQYHAPNTDEFAIDNKTLIVVPTGQEKIVKLIWEGESLISETQAGVNADGSKEYLLEKSYGMAVVPTMKYGMYKFS